MLRFLLRAACLALGTISLPTILVFATPSEQDCIDSSTTIEAKLYCIEGMGATDVTTQHPVPRGVKVFELKYLQPVDHTLAQSENFSQRLVLIHRGENEPVVLQTSGYAIFGVRQASITAVFETNQIQVEHRFFADSVPQNKDWSLLNIQQSAADFHRITVALKQIYKKRWVNTGASKGGMTSIYHRRFYPGDLDGTVADVAPLSFSTSDERYVGFVENVGGEQYQACREKFKQMQIKLLENRDELVPKIEGRYTFLGSADMAFEHAVIEFPFAFWQYSNPESPDYGCAHLPADDDVEGMLNYLNGVNAVSGYTDGGIEGFVPYYYQAATQLGNPGTMVDHLVGLRRFEFNIDQYTPKGITYDYSNAAMREVESWVKEEAREVMFVYGEFDPWSAGQFPVNPENTATYKFFVPGGNHGAKFTALGIQDRSQAVNILSRWLDKEPAKAPVTSKSMAGVGISNTLEELEFKVRKRLRL